MKTAGNYLKKNYPMKLKKKAISRKQIISKLDKIFSKYVRLRDSKYDYGHCITCNVTTYYKDAHAGHFIPRGCMYTRWDERNVHLQCCGCNTYRNGEQAKYLVALEKKYGREAVDELMELEREWKISGKMQIYELRELLETYRAKLKNIS